MATYTDQLVAVVSGTLKKFSNSDILTVTGGIESTPIGANNNESTGAFTTLSTTGATTLDSLTVTNNAIVSGNLTVSGDLTTNVSNEVLIGDSFLNLNAGYTTNSGAKSGLVLNYLPTATTDTAATGGFASTSTLTTTGASVFSAGDIVQISGAANESNNGLYEVASHSTNTLTIDTTPTHPFSKAAFVQDTGDTSAAVTKVNVRTLFADTDGTLTTSAGSTVSTVTSSATVLSTGVQQSIGDGTGTLAYDGSGNLATDATTVGLNLDGTAASRLQVTGGALSVKTVTSGNLDITSAGTLNVTDGVGDLGMDGSGDVALTVATNSAGAFILKDTAVSPVQFLAVDSTTGSAVVEVGGPLSTVTLNASKGTGSKIMIKENVPAGTSAFTIEDNQASPNTKPYLKIQSTTGAESLQFHVAPSLQADDGTVPIAQLVTFGATIAVGDVVTVSGTSGRYSLADADGGGVLGNFGGVAVSSGADGNDRAIAIHGVANVTFDGNIATSDIGKFAYLSATAGRATSTAPTATGSRVYKIGIIVNGNGTTTAQVLLQPQFLYDVP